MSEMAGRLGFYPVALLPGKIAIYFSTWGITIGSNDTSVECNRHPFKGANKRRIRKAKNPNQRF